MERLRDGQLGYVDKQLNTKQTAVCIKLKHKQISVSFIIITFMFSDVSRCQKRCTK